MNDLDKTHKTMRTNTRSKTRATLAFAVGCAVAVLATALVVAAPGANAQVTEQPNVLLLIADDFGVESSVCYAEDALTAPRLQAFCEEAVVFDNAWSSPICSPTRAGMLTGRHSFRTGIGEQATRANGLVLAESEWTLPEVLDAAGSGYATANFGKWHLGGNATRPNDMGWDHFSGLLVGGLSDYEEWSRTTNGVAETVNEYATTANVNDALDWIGEQDSPWLTWIGFNAPHSPFHLPPAHLHTQELSGTAADIDANPGLYYAAAVEALDTEIGRLVDSLTPETRDNTTIIFVGDNGNPTQVSKYGRGEAKGSIEQGGVHVPMMVWGAGVTDGGRHSDALVGTIDVFASVLELAGVDRDAVIPADVQIDSTSLVPILQGQPGQNKYLLTELFGELAQDDREGKAIRDDQYKLIEFTSGASAFYDLAADPEGQAPIGEGERTADQQARYDELAAALAAWTATPDSPAPDAIESAADACDGHAVTVNLRDGELPTAGSDVILGTDGPDLIVAGEGDDIICAGGGDDVVFGQNGNDTIFGGDGDDKLRGGDGDDAHYGGSGQDDIAGGRGQDQLFGQEGDDTAVRGGTGDDTIDAGPGNDPLVSGNGGLDTVMGGDGDDKVTGGPRPDTVLGGAGNDEVKGNKGADDLDGGAGDDELFGGPQPDSLDGGDGTDVCNGGTTGDGAPEADTAAHCETETNIETTLAP